MSTIAHRLRGMNRADADGPWWLELRAMTRLALPLIATQLGHIAINTTDIVMIGWLGPEALAAGVLGMHLYLVFFLFGLGVLSATAPLAAQALGRRDFRGVRRTARQGLWIAGVLSLPSVLVLWRSEDILLLLDQEPGNAAAAAAYVRAAAWGFAPSLAFVVLRCFTAALSRPRAAMVMMLLCVLLNVPFNYVLIFGHYGFPELGVVGAGISSSIVNSIMFAGLLGFVLLDRRLRRFGILLRFWRPDWSRFRQIFRIGLPIGGTLLCESGLFSMATFLMGWLGTAQLAAHAVALQCAAVAFMVPLGIGQAATVRVGLAIGRGDRAAVGRAGWTALVLGAVFMSGTAALFLLAPETLAGLFLDLDDPGNAIPVAYAVSFFAVAALFQLADGAQVVGGHLLRGLNDTRVPMLFALVGYWGVGLGAAYLLAFPFGLGGVGIWYGLALGLATVALLALWRFHRREDLGLFAAFAPARAA